jgi:hypothetical protein
MQLHAVSLAPFKEKYEVKRFFASTHFKGSPSTVNGMA